MFHRGIESLELHKQMNEIFEQRTFQISNFHSMLIRDSGLHNFIVPPLQYKVI